MDTVDRIWKSVKGTFIRKTKILKTPMLLATAREHFNCSTLDGVDLENQGNGLTAAMHFEKRLVMNELMSGSILRRAVVSKLTLAFFYDSGWYDVDMSQAEPLTWGRNLGCDFVLKSCYEHIETHKHGYSSASCSTNLTNSVNFNGDVMNPYFISSGMNATILPWCNEVTLSSRCLSDENALGFCDLNNLHFNLEPQFQYFSKLDNVPDNQLSSYGGRDVLADYCPMETVSLFHILRQPVSRFDLE
ncbi:leishmanolysin-like peptidase [Paragonimus westermani]|uniref:Leishmanolysin-like peptidase n=1 Tax=Paragonimus westermani TaxID=34504 RepID=A0A5J4NLT9_9TREM|nr:leishmanolysin-like peptidase [Paragonimus westermani]